MGSKTTYSCDRCKEDGLTKVKSIEGDYVPGGIYSKGYYPKLADLCDDCYDSVLRFIATPPLPLVPAPTIAKPEKPWWKIWQT